MQPGDIASMLAIQSASPQIAQWTARDYDLASLSGTFASVASENGRVTGFLVARQILDECEILNLAVDANFRRQGVATALLRALLESATQRAAATIYLEVRESNAAARMLYERHGFRKISRRTSYYKFPTEDALVLEFRLRPP
jgi:[ribosomal protein S18]-alanine N-acetyltransferase